MLFCVLAAPAFAGWRTQEIELRPGWNAVFFEVQPLPDDLETVFGGLPIESVWAWNPSRSQVQFIQDASTLVPEQPEWLSYFPFESGALTSLHAVQGGRAYLVHLRGDSNATLTLVGRPVLADLDWLGDSFNLTGLFVDPNQPPTFAAAFAGSPNLLPLNAHRLTPTGQWERVTDPGDDEIRSGEAYWIFSRGPSGYSGPMRVLLDQAGEINFGSSLLEHTVRIKNGAAVARRVEIRIGPSSALPAGELDHAGDVPLAVWDETNLEFVPLVGPISIDLGPNEESSVRLAVRRVDMAPTARPDTPYRSLLEVSDGAGLLVTLPVVARGLAGASGGVLSTVGGPSGLRKGLWVGMAKLDRVSHAGAPTDTTTPQPTGSEFPIRLILHVDRAGQTRLLREVTLLWKNGTTRPDPEDPSATVVDEPGRFVLVTSDELIPEFTGAALRGGRQVGRRISSAAFSFHDPVAMEGQFGGTLTSTPIVLGHDDPLNPFKHRYHPDHDNLGYDFEPLPTPAAPMSAGPRARCLSDHGIRTGRIAESHAVARVLRLAFTPDDPESLRLPGWGDTQIGGTYLEEVDGVHRNVICLGGSFRLHHVADVEELNDGL